MGGNLAAVGGGSLVHVLCVGTGLGEAYMYTHTMMLIDGSVKYLVVNGLPL
jgi:hypothetical protein